MFKKFSPLIKVVWWTFLSVLWVYGINVSCTLIDASSNFDVMFGFVLLSILW
jgi:hypothetical protein